MKWFTVKGEKIEFDIQVLYKDGVDVFISTVKNFNKKLDERRNYFIEKLKIFNKEKQSLTQALVSWSVYNDETPDILVKNFIEGLDKEYVISKVAKDELIIIAQKFDMVKNSPSYYSYQDEIEYILYESIYLIFQIISYIPMTKILFENYLDNYYKRLKGDKNEQC